MPVEECNYFSVRLLECRTVVWTNILAFLCVLHVQSKGSEECTEACSCRLQQLKLSSLVSIRIRQGLASLQYLEGGRRWTGRQADLSCSATSHSKVDFFKCVFIVIH